MSNNQWQYQNADQTIVCRTNPDGTFSSCLVKSVEVQASIALGVKILPMPAPIPIPVPASAVAQ